jgi:hypothetical protein
MFASKAGAKLVIGIDMSNILDQAEKIVRANGFTQDRTSSSRSDVLRPISRTKWPSAEVKRRSKLTSRRDRSGEGQARGR